MLELIWRKITLGIVVERFWQSLTLSYISLLKCVVDILVVQQAFEIRATEVAGLFLLFLGIFLKATFEVDFVNFLEDNKISYNVIFTTFWIVMFDLKLLSLLWSKTCKICGYFFFFKFSSLWQISAEMKIYIWDNEMMELRYIWYIWLKCLTKCKRRSNIPTICYRFSVTAVTIVLWGAFSKLYLTVTFKLRAAFFWMKRCWYEHYFCVSSKFHWLECLLYLTFNRPYNWIIILDYRQGSNHVYSWESLSPE